MSWLPSTIPFDFIYFRCVQGPKINLITFTSLCALKVGMTNIPMLGQIAKILLNFLGDVRLLKCITFLVHLCLKPLIIKEIGTRS